MFFSQLNRIHKDLEKLLSFASDCSGVEDHLEKARKIANEIHTLESSYTDLNERAKKVGTKIVFYANFCYR